jgi:uracil-DNA glycosylase family 4
VSRAAEHYWRLLNTVEDYLKYGERTSHDEPSRLAFRTHERPARHPAVAPRSTGDAGRSLQNDRAGFGLSEERLHQLASIAARIHKCERCPLHQGRMKAVPGAGVLDPLVMVIGEAPGAEEDRRGIPFVGRAGRYLDKWLDAINVSRDQNAFIGNIVKCRPPGNRDPNPGESDACIRYLKEQIDVIRPVTILTVGRIASSILIGSSAGIGALRGTTYSYNGIPLIPTYHPAAVLRNPALRQPVWDDLKRLAALFPGGQGDE